MVVCITTEILRFSSREDLCSIQGKDNRVTDIILPPKKNVILDATNLSSLMSCGQFYDFRFNHRFLSAKGKSNSLEVGSLIHKVLEVFYKHQINGFKRETSIGHALIAGQLYVNGCEHCAGFQSTEEN